MTLVLRRSVGARLFSGFWLQRILTSVLVLGVAAVLLSASLPDAQTSEVALSALPMLLVLAVWGLGVTAWARIDDDGVHWRYFRRHDVPWGAAELVRYGTVITGTPGLPKRAAVFVRCAGVEHPIVPAYDVRPDALSEFADGLATQAAGRHVPVVADSRLWDRCELPGAVRSESHGPGRIVSRSLRRVRMRLTGLAFVAVAVLGLAGAITGWDANGTGERIAFGVVGVLLLPVGVLLALVPGD